MKFSVILVVVVAVAVAGPPYSAAQDAELNCNILDATPVKSDCVCNNEDLIYDYGSNSCAAVEVLYKSDFCGVNYELASDGTCKCSVGLKGKACDTDIDECSAGGGAEKCDATGFLTCLNDDGSYVESADGSYYCMCDQTHYREAASHTCKVADLSDNALWNDCPQVAEADTSTAADGYKCSCFSPGFTAAKDGSCVLDDDYTDTTGKLKNITCVTDDKKKETCYPHQGYQNDQDPKVAVDVDECKAAADKITCWEHSTCHNLDGQGYECVCDTGYTDHLFDDETIKECIPKLCLEGEGPEFCYDDVCATVKCNSGEICEPVDCTTPQCKPAFESTLASQPMDVELWEGTVTVDASIAGTFMLCTFINSLESVFGVGTVQAFPDINNQYIFTVLTTSARLSGKGLVDGVAMLTAACRGLQEMDGSCVLPLGIIVNAADISMKYTKYMCKDTTCEPDTHHCSAVDENDVNLNGRYLCLCNDDAITGNFSHVNIQNCNTVSRLQSELDDTQNDLTVTGAVLGTFFALALVAVGGLAFYIYKMKH